MNKKIIKTINTYNINLIKLNDIQESFYLVT